MQISDRQTDESTLAAFGTEAVHLLRTGDIESLADRFGYALAFGRDSVAAIRADLASCLSELQADSLAPAAKPAAVTVKYFEPNGAETVALVECLAPAGTGAVLVELVVTSDGTSNHVSLEQLSVAA